jgi:acetylornithine deacetylase
MECFAQLIAQPSVSSFDPHLDQGNRGMVELLAEWFEAMGFTVELIPVQTDPPKYNLIAMLGNGTDGLVLAGHTDTVPCDATSWHSDPFQLMERDGRLYGLGATDMKNFFPIVIDALKEMDLRHLQQPLYVMATCDEESTMAGARALVESGRRLGRYALIGEPTGLKPVNRHKAIVMEMIRLIGRAGHASDPALGISALEGMHAVISGLMRWRAAVQAEHRDPAFGVPVSTLNFGTIHGGDTPNRICAECRITIDMRLLPGMDLEAIRAGLRSVSMQAIDGSGLTIEFASIIPGIPAMQTDAGAEIVKVAERLAGEPAGAVAFGTEGPYFNSMGMETVVLGAGDIAQAHQPDEYLALDRVQPMRTLLGRLITHFCMNTKL